MRVILEEFDDLKKAEKYINDYVQSPRNSFKIYPYVIEPCIIGYLVIITKE